MSENQDTGSRYFYDLTELCEYLKIPDHWFELPGAEALIPVNPGKWFNHAAGSILSQEPQTADAIGLMSKPFNNLATSAEYIRDSHNRSHCASRVREVIVDTVRVNAFSELGALPGNVGSGAYANWAADKYRIKMKVDLENLPSNTTKAYEEQKKRIRNNAQQRQKATNKVLAEMNPKIGNAISSPTVDQFGRNNRSVWTRRFFKGGGPRGGAQSAQTYIIEIPTNQTHLHNTQESIDFISGDFLLTIILIFVMLTHKTVYRFRRVRKKLAGIFSIVKTKFKRKNKIA